MIYYSTNGKAPIADLRKAVVKGLAEDRGLYMPERINKLPKAFFDDMKDMKFQDIAYNVASAFFGEDVDLDSLKDLVYDSRLTYGDKNIEFMMNESLKMMKYTYGLTVDLEPLNANDTLWLHPFLRKVYTQYGFGVINQVTFMTGQSAGLMAPPQPKEEK